MSGVIIIDDEVDAVEILKEYFEASKIDVLACGHNGKDAVELYKKHNPEIVLLDLAMPEFDGFYAIEHIQKINPEAKIILLTGSVDMISDKSLDKYDLYAVFSKPYKITELVSKVQQCSKSEKCTI